MRLEDRRVFAINLFVDFGFNFPSGGLIVSDADMADPGINGPSVFGASHTLISLADTITNESLDFNEDGTVGLTDAQDLAAQVISVINRVMAPFDVNVVQANASSIADIATSLAANGAGAGARDAYIIAAGDDPPANPAFGWAPVDLSDTNGNGVRDPGEPANQDDNTGFAFADSMIQNLSSTSIVTGLARTIVHEAGHTFGLRHVRAIEPTVAGEVMGVPFDLNTDGDTNDDNEDFRDFGVINFVTRGTYQFEDDDTVLQSSFAVLADSDVVGLRANAPAYVTGTGAHDTIEIQDLGGGFAQVTVNAFSDVDYTDLLSTQTYVILLANGILIEAGAGDDRISLEASLDASITARGGEGSDSLVVFGSGVESGSYLPATGVSDAGNVTITGGANIDFDEFEPVLVSALANFTFTTPGSADELTIEGVNPNRNRISGTSDGSAFESVTFFDVTTFTVDMGANDVPGDDADSVTIASPGLIASGLATFNLIGGTGNDTFRVRPAATAVINVSGDDPVVGDPGVPPGDRLIVDAAPGATFPLNATDGTINTPGRAPINFTSIETLVAPDQFESNDTIATATILGSEDRVTLRNLSIHSDTDVDFFRITAAFTGKIIVTALFDHEIGDLDIEVQDAFGNMITGAFSTTDNEDFVFPVVTQQAYFVRVFGYEGATNNYALEIENFAAPVPTAVLLDPNDDAGSSNLDSVTDVLTPRVIIQADLLGFVDNNSNDQLDADEIDILSAEQAAINFNLEPGTKAPGAAVQVFVNGASVGFADPIPGTNGTLFEFTIPDGALTSAFPITGGFLNLITAAVRIFDGRGDDSGDPDPATGRTTLSPPLRLIFGDLQGPQITGITANGDPLFDLFAPKQAGPTPLVDSLVITIQDPPSRALNFIHAALAQDGLIATNHFSLVGAATGPVSFFAVAINDPVVIGDVATASIQLFFDRPLADDRYTLIVHDTLTDPAGNRLDGELLLPLGNFLGFPTGNNVAGGDFVATFSVDSRAEIGTWAAGSVYLDLNGNGLFDPANFDAANRDLTNTLGFATDYVFAGKFVRDDAGGANGFDGLAVYGRVGNQTRWLIDTTGDGVPDLSFNEPAGFSAIGIPVAGNFDGNAANGDEIGVFTGQQWIFDTDHDFSLADETRRATGIQGLPVVGDFDGDGIEDLGTYDVNRNVFYLSLNGSGGGFTNPSQTHAFQLGNGFGFIGVRERPVAADMDGDGIDDLGLWVPDRSGVSIPVAEWYFLTSNEQPITNRIVLENGRPVINFSTAPFGSDLFFKFGNDFAVPVVGNFDPPVSVATPPVKVNQAPTAAQALPPVEIKPHSGSTTVDLSGLFQDPDGDSLTVSVAKNSLGSKVLTTITGGKLVLDVSGDDAASGAITLRATDTSGASVETTLQVALLAPPPVPAGVPGDATGDGRVNGADYLVWSMNFGRHSGDATPAQGDFTGDGFVDQADYIVWAANFTSASPTPAPAPVQQPAPIESVTTTVAANQPPVESAPPAVSPPEIPLVIVTSTDKPIDPPKPASTTTPKVVETSSSKKQRDAVAQALASGTADSISDLEAAALATTMSGAANDARGVALANLAGSTSKTYDEVVELLGLGGKRRK